MAWNQQLLHDRITCITESPFPGTKNTENGLCTRLSPFQAVNLYTSLQLRNLVTRFAVFLIFFYHICKPFLKGWTASYSPVRKPSYVAHMVTSLWGSDCGNLQRALSGANLDYVASLFAYYQICLQSFGRVLSYSGKLEIRMLSKEAKHKSSSCCNRVDRIHDRQVEGICCPHGCIAIIVPLQFYGVRTCWQ